MSTEDINHFLVVYNKASGRTDVQRFGTDYETAQSAYADVEWRRVRTRTSTPSC